MNLDTVYVCRSCGIMFAQKPYSDKCPVCDHRGKVTEYIDGTESRKDWHKMKRVNP